VTIVEISMNPVACCAVDNYSFISKLIIVKTSIALSAVL
jgi:hypothetical protein